MAFQVNQGGNAQNNGQPKNGQNGGQHQGNNGNQQHKNKGAGNNNQGNNQQNPWQNNQKNPWPNKGQNPWANNGQNGGGHQGGKSGKKNKNWNAEDEMDMEEGPPIAPAGFGGTGPWPVAPNPPVPWNPFQAQPAPQPQPQPAQWSAPQAPPAAFGQPVPAFGQAQPRFGQAPIPFGQAAAPFGQAHRGFGQAPTPFGQAQAPFGQAPPAWPNNAGQGQYHDPFQQPFGGQQKGNQQKGQRWLTHDEARTLVQEMQQQVHNLRQQQQEQYQRQETLYQQQQEQQQHLHQLHQQNQQLQQELQRQQHLLHQQRPYPTSPGPRLTPSMTHTEPHLTSLQQARILQARLEESFRVAMLYETALAQRAVRAPREAELRAFFAPVAGTMERAIEQIMAYGRDAEQAVFFRAMSEDEQRFLIEWQALCESYDPVQHLEGTLKDLMRRYGDDLHSPRIVGAWEAYEIGMASFKERVKRFAALCGW